MRPLCDTTRPCPSGVKQTRPARQAPRNNSIKREVIWGGPLPDTGPRRGSLSEDSLGRGWISVDGVCSSGEPGSYCLLQSSALVTSTNAKFYTRFIAVITSLVQILFLCPFIFILQDLLLWLTLFRSCSCVFLLFFFTRFFVITQILFLNLCPMVFGSIFIQNLLLFSYQRAQFLCCFR